MKFGLKNTVVDQINAVFDKHPQILKVYIYGSRARGDHRPASDIDLTMECSENTENLLSRLFFELDDLLLPYKFDLSIKDQISNQELIKQIEQHAQVFYEKK